MRCDRATAKTTRKNTQKKIKNIRFEIIRFGNKKKEQK